MKLRRDPALAGSRLILPQFSQVAVDAVKSGWPTWGSVSLIRREEMLNRVRKTAPFALAFVIVLAGVAFAGDNEGVTFSTTSDTEVAGVGGRGDGLPECFGIWNGRGVSVRHDNRVTPADAFDLEATAFTPAADFVSPGLGERGRPGQAGAANFAGALDGDGTLGDLGAYSR